MWEYYIHKLNSSLTNFFATDAREGSEMRNTNIYFITKCIYMHRKREATGRKLFFFLPGTQK